MEAVFHALYNLDNPRTGATPIYVYSNTTFDKATVMKGFTKVIPTGMPPGVDIYPRLEAMLQKKGFRDRYYRDIWVEELPQGQHVDHVVMTRQKRFRNLQCLRQLAAEYGTTLWDEKRLLRLFSQIGIPMIRTLPNMFYYKHLPRHCPST